MLDRLKKILTIGKKDAFLCLLSYIIYIGGSTYLVYHGYYFEAAIGFIGFILPIVFKKYIVKYYEFSNKFFSTARYILYGFGVILFLSAFLKINLDLYYFKLFAFFIYSFYISYFFWYFSDPEIVMMDDDMKKYKVLEEILSKYEQRNKETE